ncbi:hypothetical protein [Streptomyces sp. NPDC059092]|uniref:hypothetical protein n=1 Tax=Streptomyces sp. NPDC059092 TaxID=3346725 RepID=UPI003674CBA1
MRAFRSQAGAVAGLVVLTLTGIGSATAVQPVNSASPTDRTVMAPRVDYTGIVTTPGNADVVKSKRFDAEEWGIVYDTETVHLRCKGTGDGARWYQLLGQGNRWIIGEKLERLTPGIPDCQGDGATGGRATVKGPDNADVLKRRSVDAEQWGIVYDTETVHLHCKATTGGSTWYELSGQDGRWIIGSDLENISAGIPRC